MIKKVIKKDEVLRKGYVKNNDGVYCRKSVLERYYDKGYLDLPKSCFSAEDRLRVGQRLAVDYYLGSSRGIKSIDVSDVNIPTTGESGRESAMFYRNRYLKAVQSIPHEFWPSVRRVCVEDKKLICDLPVDKNTLKNKNDSYHQKMLLNLGLERLIEFYLKKNKKSS